MIETQRRTHDHADDAGGVEAERQHPSHEVVRLQRGGALVVPHEVVHVHGLHDSDEQHLARRGGVGAGGSRWSGSNWWMRKRAREGVGGTLEAEGARGHPPYSKLQAGE